MIVRAKRFDVEAIVPDAQKDARALTWIDRALCAALGHFACMPSKGGRGSAKQRQRSEHGGIGCPSAPDNVGSGLERGDIRLGAHSRYDVITCVNRIVAQRTQWRERTNLAFCILHFEKSMLLFGIKNGHTR